MFAMCGPTTAAAAVSRSCSGVRAGGMVSAFLLMAGPSGVEGECWQALYPAVGRAQQKSERPLTFRYSPAPVAPRLDGFRFCQVFYPFPTGLVPGLYGGISERT